MKKYFLCVFLALAACMVQNQPLSKSAADFISQSEYALFETYGTPDSVYNITPTKYVWEYDFSNLKKRNRPYQNVFSYQGAPAPQYGFAQVQSTYYCKLFWTIENGYIINYSFNGDDC